MIIGCMGAIWQALVRCPDSISFLAAAAYVVALCLAAAETARRDDGDGNSAA